jgi:hypothetical protein
MYPSAALPSLLWTVLSGLEQAHVREGSSRLGTPPLDLWANLLRAIGRSGIEQSELPAVLRLSKRAVRTRISTAVRHGWIEELKLGRGRAAVRLTAQGSAIAARWKRVERSAERAWCEHVGVDRAGRLRVVLKKIVAALPLEHPHYPASYGAADASITGGNGVDWKAVPRGRGDTVSGLSLSALTSQALVAFAMDYEERSPVALSVSVSVIGRIPAEGRRLRELGRSVDVSALLRHGFLRVSGDRGTDLVYLTPRGLDVSVAHDERIHSVELEWSNRFGAASIGTLRSVLEDVATRASLPFPVPARNNGR